MAFLPVYYLTLVCPTLERTMEMAEQYIAHGARALQFDLPSREPTFETPLVQQMMARALATYDGYAVYLDALRALGRRQPGVELHLVVYPDVVEHIGLVEFAAFCREVPLASVMLAVPCPELETALEQAGLPLLTMAGNSLSHKTLDRLCAVPEERVVVVSYKRPMALHSGMCNSFTDKLRYLRALGVRARVFAVEGVADAQMMCEVRDAGASGALVGNVLMQLWNDPPALWEKIAAFQALAEC